jgi:pimeloyl-ACP methyl ester carboxylesterase
MESTQYFDLAVEGVGDVCLTVTERGEGRPVLLLHGGGGLRTVTGWAQAFAAAEPARVLTPTHPGFDGTPRPDALHSVAGLADGYVALLDRLGLSDVVVVGNSMGGWIAAELAIRRPRQVRAYVLVDAVGLDFPEHPVADFFALSPAEIAARAYHDPATFGLDPSTLPPAARAALAADRTTLAAYSEHGMTDPTLGPRLAGVGDPVLVVWGEADRIADPEYGRAFAAAIPGARFELLSATGHLPQIETPERLTEVVQEFLRAL